MRLYSLGTVDYAVTCGGRLPRDRSWSRIIFPGDILILLFVPFSAQWVYVLSCLGPVWIPACAWKYSP